MHSIHRLICKKCQKIIESCNPTLPDETCSVCLLKMKFEGLGQKVIDEAPALSSKGLPTPKFYPR